MPFIPVNLDEAQETKPAPAGRYDLQIVDCQVVKTGPNSKHPGSPQFKVFIAFPAEVNSPALSQFISLPHEADEPDSSRFKQLLLKRFLHQFSIPYDPKGIDTDQLSMAMVGCTANAEVTLSEPDKETGAVYNRLVTPRLKDETSGVRRAA